jgi:hypothetical protein
MLNMVYLLLELGIEIEMPLFYLLELTQGSLKLDTVMM